MCNRFECCNDSFQPQIDYYLELSPMIDSVRESKPIKFYSFIKGNE